ILARRVGKTEQLWRWCRRNPRVAGLCAALVLAVTAGIGGVCWKWRDAERNFEQAERNRLLAESLLSDAENNIYYQRLALAQARWHDNNVRGVRPVLDKCPPRLRDWEWHYYQRLCQAESFGVTEPAGPVLAVTFSPTGAQFASTSSEDSSVKLWDVATHKLKRVLHGHAAYVETVAF